MQNHRRTPLSQCVRPQPGQFELLSLSIRQRNQDHRRGAANHANELRRTYYRKEKLMGRYDEGVIRLIIQIRSEGVSIH